MKPPTVPYVSVPSQASAPRVVAGSASAPRVVAGSASAPRVVAGSASALLRSVAGMAAAGVSRFAARPGALPRNSGSSDLDALKNQLERGQRIEPAEFSRIFSDHMSQKFNSHPLIAELREILNDKQISIDERQEIEFLLIEATREMGFGFPDLCNELWDNAFLGTIRKMGRQAMSLFKQTFFYSLFSEHFKVDETHAERFYEPASEQLPPKSLSVYVRDTFKAQPTDRPLIKVFLEAMRLGKKPYLNPWALHVIVIVLESSGEPFFRETSKIFKNNSYLGKGHKGEEDNHAQGEAENEKKFLEASSDQETLLKRLGFRQLRDHEAQLEALEVGKRTGAAMAEYLDGIHKRLAGLRKSQVDRRSAKSAVSEGEKPQSDTNVDSSNPQPTSEAVDIGVKFVNSVSGSLILMKSFLQIRLQQLNGNPDSPAYKKIKVLLKEHEALEEPIIALSQLIEDYHPYLKNHHINQAKFFSDAGNEERKKVLKSLRRSAVANTENDAQYAAISKFYELVITELMDIQTQFNNDQTIKTTIENLITQINNIKQTIGVSN